MIDITKVKVGDEIERKSGSGRVVVKKIEPGNLVTKFWYEVGGNSWYCLACDVTAHYPKEPPTPPQFKVGDRVYLSDPHDNMCGKPGVVQNTSTEPKLVNTIGVRFDGDEFLTWYAPFQLSRGPIDPPQAKRDNNSIKAINFTSLMGDPSKIVACRGSDGSVIINRKKTYWYLPKDAMTELCRWYLDLTEQANG